VRPVARSARGEDLAVRLVATPIVRVIGLVVSALLLMSCGDDGDSTGSSASAPVLLNLRVLALNPEKANTNVSYDVSSDFTDPNGDVQGGQCEFLLDGQSIGRSTLTADPGTSATLTSGVVECQFFVNSPVPDQIQVTFRIYDLAGNRSNDLNFVLTITQLPRGSPSGGAAPVAGRMGSATVRR
jgi:hypothetical protein